MEKTYVIINPYCKINYASFYIVGIHGIFSLDNIKYGFRYFRQFPDTSRCLTFTLIAKDQTPINFAIDFHDDRLCDLAVLEWCHHYAKINLHDTTMVNLMEQGQEFFDRNKTKIFSITPGFGVRCFSAFETANFILKLLLSGRSGVRENILDTLRAYVKRRPLSLYQKSNSFSDYIFFIATIWDKATDYINLQRAKFIRACKNLSEVKFEGGFVDVGYDASYIEDLEELMYKDRKIPLDEFIDKTKRSSLVFNNPSVAYCHGWKLGEYLAMAKAIISVPLSNQLPVPLKHRANIFFVEDSEASIQSAIEEIIGNDKLRHTLEHGAKDYWERVAKPEAVISYILSKAGIN